MAFNWPGFFTRLGSAIVFSLIMMVGLLWNEWAFLVLISLITTLCIREFFGICTHIFHDVILPKYLLFGTIIFAWILLWIPFCLAHLDGLPINIAQQKYLPALLIGFPMIILSSILSNKAGLRGCFIAICALIYIGFPALMLIAMRLQSLLIPLALILLIWMNDTMAYLVGSFIGKTPFSKISPKKTWEGTVGGAVLTLILAVIWGWKSGLFDIVDWIVLAVCASVAGTAGDLLESKLKRLALIKDSGKIMPGHGGALDRFDSLLIATPFAFAYAWLFMEALPISVF